MKLLIFLTCISLGFALPLKDDDFEISLLKDYNVANEDGGFKYGFKATNGISTKVVGTADKESNIVAVSSKYKYIDPNGNLVRGQYNVEADGSVNGKYSYTDANDEPVEVTFTATKSGFVPFGTNIAKVISENAANATPWDESETYTKTEVKVTPSKPKPVRPKY